MSATDWHEGRWHYRRSLASRVAVLTTMVLGVAITILAATAFVVMRQQLMSSLDQSLLNRAHRATADTTLSRVTARGVPPWVLGAADVRIMVVTADGQVAGTDIPSFTLGQPEYEVVTGRRSSSSRTLVTDGGGEGRLEWLTLRDVDAGTEERVDAAGLYVVDRGSTNGSTVTTPDGATRRCVPGETVYVAPGSIVSMGDHWLEVRHGDGAAGR